MKKLGKNYQILQNGITKKKDNEKYISYNNHMNEQIPNINFNHNCCTRDFKVMKLDEFFSQEEILHEIYNPHRLKFFQMVFITDGEGKHMVDLHSVPLQKGILFFSSPGQVQAYDSAHSYSGYICIFTEEFLNREFLQIADRHIIDYLYFQDITEALVLEDSSLEVYFELLLKEFVASTVTLQEGVVASLLNCILHKSKEHFSDTLLDTKNSELFNTFKKTLLAEFKELHNAEEYANILKVTPKHLNVICKQITGFTTKAFIDRFRIVEVKRYLASSTLPIKEIATNMGYWEVSNFVKFFKKHTGLTPKAFRDSLLLLT